MRRTVVTLGVLLVALLSAGFQAQAAVVHPFTTQITGGKPPPFSEILCGVDVDPASGEVYVDDPETPGTVEIFSKENVFLGQIKEKLGEGACSTAVNDTTGTAYVANPGGGEFAKLPPKVSSREEAVFVYAGGTHSFEEAKLVNGSETPAGSFMSTESEGNLEAGGALHVAVAQKSAAANSEHLYVSVAEQGVIDEFDANGKYLKQIALAPLAFPATSTPENLAIDSSGDVYVIVEQGLESVLSTVVDEFSPAGALIRTISGEQAGGFGRLSGLALDAAGHVYVSDAENRVVDELDSSGSLVGQIAGADTPAGSLIEPVGVAVNQQNGTIYVAEATQTRQSGSPGFVNVFGSGTGAKAPFLLDEGAASISATTATLQARVDHPAGVEAKLSFEYAPEGGAFTSTPEQSAAAGEGVQLLTAQLQGLSANTTYRFRAVLTVGAAKEEGALESFTTLTEGAGLTLPDGRAWELVSPPNKLGAAIQGIGVQGVVQAAVDGSKITYSASAPIELNAPANASESPALSTRAGGKWSTREIIAPNYPPTGQAVLGSNGLENRIFSSDLSHSILQPFKLEPLLSPWATERGPYLRDLNDVACPITETTCYLPLVIGEGKGEPTEKLADDDSKVPFGGGPLSQNGASFGEVTTAAANPTLSAVALESKVPLRATHVNEVTKTEEKLQEGGLYEWTAGKSPAETLQLVSVLPNGTAIGGSFSEPKIGSERGAGHNVRNAVSADGSRIVWSTFASPRHLYLRDTSRDETIQLDKPEVGEGEGVSQPEFQTASTDGSTYFFTDEQKLTKESTASTGNPDLYSCRVTVGGEGKLSCPVTDLTDAKAVKNVGEHAGVQGSLPGASTDGSEIYFVANGVLSTAPNAQGETAVPGSCGEFPTRTSSCNLYAEHFNGATWDEPKLIAVLSADDGPDWGAKASGERRVANSLQLSQLSSRVSPEGQYLAFMSDRRLTGYDNTDASPAAAGAADEEVFRYSLGAGRVLCVSCNRSGQRPQGVFDQPLNEAGKGELIIDHRHVWAGRWLAASVPGWTAFSSQIAAYQSRYLSDSGRMFFNAADALVPQDKNGAIADVYEYDPEGLGGCALSIGCQALISSGESEEESAFLDASESGDDAFFLTAGKLVSQDVDQSYDVYDAHVCTGPSPCITPPPSPAPPCSSSESCQGGGGQQSGGGAAPASAISPASGNVVPPPAAHGNSPIRTATPTRAQRLSKALRTCRKLKHKKPRVACERRARKKYGAKKAAHHSKSASRGKR